VKHGASAYRNGRCLCEICTEDHRARHARENASRVARLAADPSLAPHGSRQTYVNWGCRCAACSEAHSAYCASYYKANRGVS